MQFGQTQDYAGCPVDGALDIERANPAPGDGHQVFMNVTLNASDVQAGSTFAWAAFDVAGEPSTVAASMLCFAQDPLDPKHLEVFYSLDNPPGYVKFQVTYAAAGGGNKTHQACAHLFGLD